MRWKRWNLKIRIMECGKPAWQVAQDLNIRPELLSKVTSGAADPSPELRRKLIEYFGCSEADLFGEGH